MTAAPPRTISVVLVDDHHMFRTGVRRAAPRARRITLEIVGEAGAVERRPWSRRAALTSCCWTCTCPAATVAAAPT